MKSRRFLKTIAIFVVLIICLVAFASCSYVDDVFDLFRGDPINYTLSEDGNYYMVWCGGCGNCKHGNTVLPSVYKELPVKSIGRSAFYNCTSLTSITIPDSVISIDNDAFSGCSGLLSLTIPDSVTSVGDYAFHNCTSLVSIIIPNSITSIGTEAFYNCPSLAYNEYDNAYYLGNDINPYVVLVKAKDTYITNCTINENTRFIHSSAFSDCTSLTSITIPDSVISIGNNAFYNCPSLAYNEYDNAYYLGNDSNPYLVLVKAKNTSITNCIINENTRFIHSDTFYGCTSLKSITIPDSVTSIDYSAFSHCTSLTSITIPNSVTSIGEAAFEDCTSLTSITFEGTVEQWNAISRGSYWKNHVPATEVICSDGTVTL